MQHKLKLPVEVRQTLLQYADKLGLYMEGNLLKIIDAEDDPAFLDYLKEAAERDLNIRSKRLRITKQIQEQNKNLVMLNEKLQQTITELELERDKAEEALRKSNRQNEGIVQFSWMLSHNLRGPVASLLGVINLFSRDKNLPPQSGAMVKLLSETAGKIDFKIKEISEVLETHIMQPEAVDFINLESVVSEIYEECAGENYEASVEFISDIPAGLEIQFPSEAIRKILRSLFENALVFRRDGVLHQIRAGYSDKKYEHRLLISDNGVGIPENLFNRIFEPFKVCSEKSTGRGMGLYIVKSLMESINGSVEVESTPGEGTTFILVIPKVR
jgi:signal transduction histidine kinase